MKLKITILFFLYFLWSAAYCISQYTNSVIIPTNYNMESAADPFVLKDSNGSYYCYVTGKGFPTFVSRDLVRWIKASTNPFPDNSYKWAKGNFWAPEVVKVGGTYYMHYSAKAADEFMKIGLAKSSSPLGPFADVSNKPFYSMKNTHIIDSHIFFDDNGKAYLIFAKNLMNYILGDTIRKRSEIWGIEIKPDLSDTIGPAKQLFYPSQGWENPYNNEAWNEAPTMIKHNDMYYIMYSANCYCDNYSVGYAIARSPLGPWVKYPGNPILKSVPNYVSGPGHNSVVMSPDNSEIFCVYHSHIDLLTKGGYRKVNIDRMGFTANGVLYINGPTYIAQNYPSATMSGIEDPVSVSSKLGIIYDPATEQINIYIPANSSKVSVYNACGMLVYTSPINMDMNRLYIPLDKLPLGIYIVRLDNHYMSSITGKFIKR